MEHLKELTRNLLFSLTIGSPLPGSSSFTDRGHDPRELLIALVEELRKLDPADFDADVRARFIVLRSTMDDQSTPSRGIYNEHVLRSDALKLLEVLDQHYAPRTGEAPRDFSFVSSPGLRSIVERDYQELSRNAYPSRSWKSTVVLSGGILEAVLFDRLTRDRETIDAANGDPNAPRKKGGVKKDITSQDDEDEWKLDHYIKVAHSLGILLTHDEKTVHLTLKRYRNLVHPRAEMKQPVPLSAGHARCAYGMLDVILDQLAAEHDSA